MAGIHISSNSWGGLPYYQNQDLAVIKDSKMVSLVEGMA